MDFNYSASLLICVSLQRILRNANAGNYRERFLKTIYENITSSIGIYSQDVLCRDIRKNKDLVRFMTSNTNPYSLFGRIDIYDIDTKEGTINPFLVIPNLPDPEDRRIILDWEILRKKFYKD